MVSLRNPYHGVKMRSLDIDEALDNSAPEVRRKKRYSLDSIISHTLPRVKNKRRSKEKEDVYPSGIGNSLTPGSKKASKNTRRKSGLFLVDKWNSVMGAMKFSSNKEATTSS